MYVYLRMCARRYVCECMSEGGEGGAYPSLIERAVCLKDQAKGVGGGATPPRDPLSP